MVFLLHDTLKNNSDAGHVRIDLLKCYTTQLKSQKKKKNKNVQSQPQN